MLYFKRALQSQDSGDYYAPAFLTYTRMGIPVTALLEQGVPATVPAAQAFLRFLMGAGRVSDSQTAWEWIRRHCLLDDQLSSDYLIFLIGNQRPDSAAKSWATVNTAVAPDYRLRNWVFNEGFEAEPRLAPLDWHVASTDDVQVSRSQSEVHDGKWSLELAFAGESNVDFHEVFQETVLTPGKWHLQAFVKTQKLTTDQGISVRILGTAQSAHLDVRTDELAGDHDWTKVERSFIVPPETGIVRLEVMREPSLKIDNKIAGRVWVDSLELKPIPEPNRFR
jgi:hypothetical protein